MKIKLLTKSAVMFLALVATLCFLFVLNSVKSISVKADVLESDFYVEHGAFMRTEEPYGLRFIAKISTSKYAEIVENGKIKPDKTLGMIVVPYSYVEDYIAAGASDYYTYFQDVKKKMINATFGANQIIAVDNNKNGITDWYEIRLVIKEIQFNNLNRDYSAIGYINTTGEIPEYTEVLSTDKRSFSTVVKTADENGVGTANGIQDYIDDILYKADYNAAGAKYDQTTEQYYVSGLPEAKYEDLKAIPVATSYNALPISYDNDTIGHFIEVSECIDIRNANATVDDAYYNDGKPVYAVTYSNESGIFPVSIHGITSDDISDNNIKKLTFKMYVTADFNLSQFRIGYQGGTLKTMTSGNLNSYNPIRLFDRNLNSVGDYPVGQEGWLTVEIICASASDLNTVFYNVYSTYNSNKDKPLYISEAELSSADMTKKGFAIEGANGNGRFVNYDDSAFIEMTKLYGLSGKEAYYLSGKDIYQVTYTNASGDYAMKVDGIDAEDLGDNVRYLKFKMYVTSDFHAERFYIVWNAVGGSYAKRLVKTSLKNYENIRMYDSSNTRIYGFSGTGWVNLEVLIKDENNEGLASLFYLVYGENSSNQNHPLYIADIRFST